ncbi:MAG: hypothetical protein ACYDA6_00275 [Solirubrobacteraceae bacterium]
MTSHEIAERAIVLQLLRDDHDRVWWRAEIETVLGDMAPLTLEHALGSLADAGVVELRGERAMAGPATVRLDALGLIAV